MSLSLRRVPSSLGCLIAFCVEKALSPPAEMGPNGGCSGPVRGRRQQQQQQPQRRGLCD